MEIDIDIPELTSLVQRYGSRAGPIIAEEMKRAGDRSGARVQRKAQGKVRVKTGHLRRSVTFATTLQGFGTETKVGTAVPYGRYLEEGTGIYGPKGAPIRPHGKFLVFQVGGKTVFARSVRGVPGDKWLTSSFKDETPAVRKEFDRALQIIVNRMTKGG